MIVCGTVSIPAANVGHSLYSLLVTAGKIAADTATRPNPYDGRIAALKMRVDPANVADHVYVVDKEGAVTLATDAGFSFSNEVATDPVPTFEERMGPANQMSLKNMFIASDGAGAVAVQVWALVV